MVSTPGGGPTSEQPGRSSTLTPATHLGARGNSPLQWNGWSFLCATVGLSIWMPVTAILSDWNGAGFALSGATALTVWVAALVLWNQRDRISAFSGFMWLLAVGFVSSATFLFGADWLDLPVRSNWPTAAVMSPLHYVWMLGLFPVVAVWIWIRHRGGMPPADSRPLFGWLRALALVGVGMLVLFAVMIAISIGRANRAKELAQRARAVEAMAGLAMFSPMVGEGIGTNEFTAG